jgi:hypothetical protein
MNKSIEELKKGMGCIIEPIKETDAIFDFIFGGIKGAPVNWKQWIPLQEKQIYIPFCVIFSRLNCAETKARSNGEWDLNFSDRYLGVISGTTKEGNSLNAVSEAFRTQGTVAEDKCPWKSQDWLLAPFNHWGEIFNLSDVPADAKKYLGGNHSYVVGGFQGVKNALQLSPVQIAVGIGDNWETNGIVHPPTQILAYHAVQVYYASDRYFINDSCGKQFKELSADYPIVQAKSFADLPDNWKELNKPMYQLIKKRGGTTVCAIIFGKNYWIDSMDKITQGQKEGLFSPDIKEQDAMDINGEFRDFPLA